MAQRNRRDDVRPDGGRTRDHFERDFDTDRAPAHRAPRDRFDRAHDRIDDLDRAGFDAEPTDRTARREQSNREHAGREEPTGHENAATWDRPSRGFPDEFDRHYDTYETRPNPQGAYDEPDFLLNERGVYDEPGYSVDEPYEQNFDSTGRQRRGGDDTRDYLQSGWGNEPRGQSTHDHAGYGSASENQPVSRENPNAYRPSPYAPPPGRRGGDPESQYGGVFGEHGPDHPGYFPPGRHDDRIRNEIMERLEFDPTVQPWRMRVEVHEGEVCLRGVVSSPHERHRAEEVADAVRGVRDIHNELRVDRSRQAQGRSRSGR